MERHGKISQNEGEMPARKTDREQKGREKQDGGELRRLKNATSRSCRAVTKRDHQFFLTSSSYYNTSMYYRVRATVTTQI